MQFTDKYVANLKPQSRQFVKREGRGFAVRVLPTGQKTWLFIYTFDGRRRQMNLGSYPDKSLADARADYSKAYAILRDKANPRDPQEERDRSQREDRDQREEHRRHPTIAQLIEEYLVKFAMVRKKTWQEDKRILEKDVLPVWGLRKAKEIRRQDVISLLDGMQGRGPAITLNTFKIIRRMFKYAVKKDIIGQSPCIGFESDDELPVVASREHVLTEAEIKFFWAAVEKASMSSVTRRALKLILVTCQRPGEVVVMHRSQIKGRWWEFEPKPTRITKVTPRLQRIYLTDLALELIGDAEGDIFPSPTTGGPMTERALAYAIRRNLKGYMGRKPGDAPMMSRVKEDRKIDMEHFIPHDLRRTGATKIASLGFSDEIVDAILAHLKKGTIRIYNRHKYDKEKQASLEAWEHKLNGIIFGSEKKIISIKRNMTAVDN